MSGRSAGGEPVRPIEWVAGGAVRLLDQRKLPRREAYLRCRSAEEVAEAIAGLAVRGAPLLGVAAGLGMALAARRSDARSPRGMLRDLERAGRRLVAARPTAVNVRWAVERVMGRVREARGGPDTLAKVALDEALRIQMEDEEACRAIGEHGADLVPSGARLLTHCNTGALATAGHGTAQSVIHAAHEQGKGVHVWVGETRPVLQGARLTAWELQRMGVPMTLVADTAAGSLMARGLVDLVVVGADRIAANGDVANKVGTYQLAVLARHHDIPFYVAAPSSTVDLETPDGSAIPIEERDPDEVTAPMGMVLAPPGTPAHNPAFDVTPAALVTAIVTERGVVRPPYGPALPGVAAA